MRRILLLGAGNLGSRYLQGLALLEEKFLIYVVDPSSASLSAARTRWNEAIGSTGQEIICLTSLDGVPKHLALVIIATPASCRSQVVDEISKNFVVSYWVLEKVLAQSSRQVSDILEFLEGGSDVWVNTSRRLMAWHQEIRSQINLSIDQPLRVRVAGGAWGLGCNAIHFIDLVCWWTGASVEVVDCRRLRDWKPSKRSGFQEVFGTLDVSFHDGSSLELQCDQSDDQLLIEVETSQGNWVIKEAAGEAVGPNGKVIFGKLSFQSDLTAPLVDQILTAGRCSLPCLADSAAQHHLLLNALLQHWNNSQSREDLVVPIT